MIIKCGAGEIDNINLILLVQLEYNIQIFMCEFGYSITEEYKFN